MPRLLASALLAAVLASPLPVRAQGVADAECEADPAACGRKAFDAGVEAYKRNAWKEALDHFQRAHAVRAYPIVIYNLALTEEKLGMYVEALRHVEQLEKAPDRGAELGAKAKEMRQRLVRQVVTLSVDLPNARDVRLMVDDTEFTEITDVRINPGAHSVLVTADGRKRIHKEIETQPGERIVLSLDSERAPTGETAIGANEASIRSRGLSPIWFYVATGATVVIGGVAIWSGLDTLDAKSDYDRDLSDLSAEEEQRRLDDGHARERRTNILFGVTGALAITTAALGLFAVDWNPDRDKRVKLAPTPGGAVLHGRF